MLGDWKDSQHPSNAPSMMGSTQIWCTDDISSSSTSPKTGFDFTMALAKHELIVTLMKEFYAIFDTEWKADIRSCASSGSGPSRPQSKSSALAPLAGKNSKRRTQDRDSPPLDDGNGSGKRGKKGGPDTGHHTQGRLFACPFHKHDPSKYCLNDDTGAAYRSCPGPGFASISHLK